MEEESVVMKGIGQYKFDGRFKMDRFDTNTSKVSGVEHWSFYTIKAYFGTLKN